MAALVLRKSNRLSSFPFFSLFRSHLTPFPSYDSYFTDSTPSSLTWCRTMASCRDSRVDIGTIGQFGHGKTTLSAAISRVLADEGRGIAVPFEEINRVAGDHRSAHHLSYETSKRKYSHVDCTEHCDYIRVCSVLGWSVLVVA